MSQQPQRRLPLQLRVAHLGFDGPTAFARLTHETMDLPANVLGELIEELNTRLTRYCSRAELPLGGPTGTLHISRVLIDDGDLKDSTWQQVICDLLDYEEPTPQEPQVKVDSKQDKSDGKKAKKRNRRKKTRVLGDSSGKPDLNKIGYGVKVAPSGKFESPDDQQSSTLPGFGALDDLPVDVTQLLLGLVRGLHVRVTHTTVEVNGK